VSILVVVAKNIFTTKLSEEQTLSAWENRRLCRWRLELWRLKRDC